MCENDPNNAYRWQSWETYINNAPDGDSRLRRVEIWQEASRLMQEGRD